MMPMLLLPDTRLPVVETLSSVPARNAGTGTLTRAATDAEAIVGWLQRHADSPHTLESYRREAERLLLWSAARQLTLRQIMVEDMTDYLAWLHDPQPVERWCLQLEPRTLADGSPNPAWRQVRRVPRMLPDGAPNPSWRPFVSGLSESTARLAETILFGMFEYLAGVGYLAANPLRAARKRRPKPKAEVERYLEQDLWDWLLDYIERMPREIRRAESHRQRIRFLIGCMYLTGLRISEMAAARTTDLVFKRKAWWLRVLGKGSKQGDVPLPQDALESLKAYRQALGRSPWPDSDKSEPLVMDICGKGRALTAKAIHQIVTDFFATAAQEASPEHARVLRDASCHWLRHTNATHQLEAGVPLIVVRDNLRHSSVQTTEGYVHTSRDKQHQETERHQLRRST